MAADKASLIAKLQKEKIGLEARIKELNKVIESLRKVRSKL